MTACACIHNKHMALLTLEASRLADKRRDAGCQGPGTLTGCVLCVQLVLPPGVVINSYTLMCAD